MSISPNILRQAPSPTPLVIDTGRQNKNDQTDKNGALKTVNKIDNPVPKLGEKKSTLSVFKETVMSKLQEKLRDRARVLAKSMEVSD